jgi:CheY-like chemotaxis protein
MRRADPPAEHRTLMDLLPCFGLPGRSRACGRRELRRPADNRRLAGRDDPGRFDLVLTDEVMPVMPGMTGTQLALALYQIRPEVPIVLMIGHGGRARLHRLRAAGIRCVLKKPLLSRHCGRPCPASSSRRVISDAAGLPGQRLPTLLRLPSFTPQKQNSSCFISGAYIL